MGIEGISSSVVIALAAVLWLVYLIPTWFRRREYLSTERNAVRLQQTIRIMAETAEVPETVHLEADARTAVERERLVRRRFERERAIAMAKEAAQKRAAARTLASLHPTIAADTVRFSPASRRLRRSRAATGVVLVTAVLAVAASFTPVLANVSTAVAVSGIALALCAVAALNRMAAVTRTRADVARRLRSQPERERRPAASAEPIAPSHEESSWTPVPVPRPLYLSRPAPQPVVSEAMLAEARERLLAEAIEKENAELARERAEKVTPIRQPASGSRYAMMGIVDASETVATDLDAALRRRRAV